MSIQVALHHSTTYVYDKKIALGPQVIRLRPAPHCRTRIVSYSQTVSPKSHFLNWQQDPFGNFLARLVFPEKTERFQVDIDLVADMKVINPFDFFLEPDARTFPLEYVPSLKKDLEPYLKTETPGKGLKAFLDRIDRTEKNTVDFLVEINQALEKAISYTIRMEPNVQTPEQTLELSSGSCRDSAWLLVHILRHLGLAARFVSGYLIQLAQDVKSLDGPSGPEADFTDLHAWTEVFIPGAGWIGLDPTSGLLAGEGHIPLAASPEPQSAAPITGALDECKVDFSHKMSVTRIAESPRATKPYPEEVWTRALELGHAVDKEMEDMDVRLTMGGEPTFISIDDMEGPEWNTEAVGPAKQKMGANLMRDLHKSWAPGGLLHFGQGKWYPGESLPRWAYACIFRKDGQPIWKNPDLLADPNRDYGFGTDEAKTFITELTRTLGVTDRHIRPAHEDFFYFLWKEQRLPVNVSPEDSKLANPEDRARLADVFDRGLDAVTGFVLPLKYGSWKTGPWPFRSGNLFLLPGDSPMGLRLPMDGLPWVSKQDYPYLVSRDPMAQHPNLPDPDAALEQNRAKALERGRAAQPERENAPEPDQAPKDRLPGIGESDTATIRTALCIQPKAGRLHVFMPPLEQAHQYLELVRAVEITADKTAMPVIIEGYLPPYDPNLNTLKITPDPGVLEVNIHPAASWEELVKTTTELYDAARRNRLGTEKFLIDGRHTGTGGGNHIVLGGVSPQDSPILRRPDLLRSLVTYFNNHPALSYLFSGLFIGPTSQRPRVDEARHDSLYELEIAFAELDRQMGIHGTGGQETPQAGACPPWLTDRLFRHLLADVTGNTHRTEFCIDKLYSPDSSSGRLGLLELRTFEMPPHARMSLVQQLLLRVLVAWFWKTPYRTPLVHWGTRLHDRFMLPHFVAADLAAVLRELNDAGYPLTMEHFHPHFEFRFPELGSLAVDNIRMELRTAMEPWHVLGEEPGGGGTVRFVDSSLERLQVKVEGITEGRHTVLCNGRQVPLHSTGISGVMVAGVRFRAWQPPSCLHPTIPVHVPLIFDLVDTWSGRAIGGCRYDVGHPGGRNYETFPVNENEAEGRRTARFTPLSHTPGPANTMGDTPVNPAFPMTLDLRRV